MSATDSIATRSRLDSLNRNYQVSEDDVNATLRQYKNDLPRWRKFYERVIKRLEALQKPDTTHA